MMLVLKVERKDTESRGSIQHLKLFMLPTAKKKSKHGLALSPSHKTRNRTIAPFSYRYVSLLRLRIYASANPIEIRNPMDGCPMSLALLIM